MLDPGAVLLLVGYALVSWCFAGLALVNPGTRIPGRLPAVTHPPGYMSTGCAGLAAVITGAVMVCGSPRVYAWILAIAVVAAAVAVPLAVHNRRLR